MWGAPVRKKCGLAQKVARVDVHHVTQVRCNAWGICLSLSDLCTCRIICSSCLHHLFRQYGMAFEGGKPLALIMCGVRTTDVAQSAQGMVVMEGGNPSLFCSSVSDLMLRPMSYASDLDDLHKSRLRRI